MKLVQCLLRRLDFARQSVPRCSRVLVVGVALALTLGTWGHLVLAGIGIEMSAWESLVHELCDPFCHQYAARSFQVSGHVFPLCARCTGMWVGITFGVVLAMIIVPRHRWWSGVMLAVVATAASGFDFLREQSGGAPYAWVRAILGFQLFLGVTLAVSFDVLAVLVAVGRRVSSPLRTKSLASSQRNAK